MAIMHYFLQEKPKLDIYNIFIKCQQSNSEQKTQ